MNWQLLILASVILYSVAVIIQKILLRDEKSDPIAYSIFFQLIVGLLVAMFGFAYTNMSVGNIRPISGNLLLMVLLYSIANIFIFKALKTTDASKFTILFSTRGFFTVFASSLFLGESLKITQWVGALIIFSGIVLVSLESLKFHIEKNETLAFFAAIAFGLANTNDRVILKSLNLYPYVSIAFIVPAIFMIILYPRSIVKMKVFLSKSLLIKMILFSIIYAASAVTFFSALQIANNSSQVVTINLTSVILTVILSIIFLKENKKVWQKIFGAALSFIGLLLVS